MPHAPKDCDTPCTIIKNALYLCGMSKLELKKYLKSLKKKALEEQILDLYSRYKEVKVFYDFAFNPKEQDMMDAAKARINKEYFPQTRRRPKARRSVAQNLIKHYLTLGMEPGLIADLMLYNIETAIAFAQQRPPRQDSFYTSMLRSYQQCLDHLHYYQLAATFLTRVEAIEDLSRQLKWPNADQFNDSLYLALGRYNKSQSQNP